MVFLSGVGLFRKQNERSKDNTFQKTEENETQWRGSLARPRDEQACRWYKSYIGNLGVGTRVISYLLFPPRAIVYIILEKDLDS